MREFFEHTADLGIRVRAESLSALYAEAGVALFELIVENIHEVAELTSRPIQLKPTSLDLQLFDWLNELLYLYESQHFLGSRCVVEFHSGALFATIFGEPQDETRHQLDHEVKAITYHHLLVKQEMDGTWLAEVIVDI